MESPEQPKDYPRAANVIPLPSPVRTFLSQVAGPLTVALLLALSGGIVNLFSDNILLNERIGVISGRVAALESKAGEGSRYTGEMAEMSHAETRRKFEALQSGLTDLRVLVAGMLAKQKR